MVRPSTRALLALLALGAVAVGACAGEDAASSSEHAVGTVPPRTWTPAKTKDGNLRIATLNIRNFPSMPEAEASDGGASTPEGGTTPSGDGGANTGDANAGADAGNANAPDIDRRPSLVRTRESTDIALLLDVLERLDFDVLGVQEVRDTERFRQVLRELGDRYSQGQGQGVQPRRYDVVFDTTWEHPQHVGIVYRADRLRASDVTSHPEVARRPTMRAGLSARFTSLREGGADFGVMVLHLASGDTNNRATFRAEQASHAASAVANLQATLGDQDFVVLGDLNTARGEPELTALDGTMAGSAARLSRLAPDLACTTYHVKSPNQPLLQPGATDHVYVAGLAERDTTVPLAVGTHCFERSCAPFESDSAAHGTTYWGVSDHCPVYFEIKDQDDDR